jgi:hypothetical protein
MNSYINNILLEFFNWERAAGAAGGSDTLDLICNDCFYCRNKETYPPFKNGRYLEEYLFSYAKRICRGARVVYDRSGKLYIPALWTNFQIEDWFDRERDTMQRALDKFIEEHPCPAGYFTFVQYDDGPKLRLPEKTLVYGACSGNIPLPLIYEDADERLVRACVGAGAGGAGGAGARGRDIFASFVGTDTHHSRRALINMYQNNPRFVFRDRGGWSAQVDANSQKAFIELSLRSKFVLCPRGYGRSSFRFFEVLKMPGAGIPVYIWDDHEWLPYKDILDYSRFCVSINVKDLGRLQEILENISDEKYMEMKREGAAVASVFGLEFMCRFLVGRGAAAA